MCNVVIARADDWQALYLNGEVLHQSHNIDLHHLKMYLPQDTKLSDINEWYRDEFVDYAYQNGYLPEKLEVLEELVGELAPSSSF